MSNWRQYKRDWAISDDGKSLRVLFFEQLLYDDGTLMFQPVPLSLRYDTPKGWMDLFFGRSGDEVVVSTPGPHFVRWRNVGKPPGEAMTPAEIVALKEDVEAAYAALGERVRFREDEYR